MSPYNPIHAKRHYEKNKDKIKERQKNRFGGDAEKLREYNKMRRYQSWSHYFSSLTARRKVKSFTKEDLLLLLEKQKGKCALSGLTLTMEIGSPYNASIDRIDAGKEYSIENIQLVCKCVNTWRGSLSLPLFISICKAVAENNK